MGSHCGVHKEPFVVQRVQIAEDHATVALRILTIL